MLSFILTKSVYAQPGRYYRDLDMPAEGYITGQIALTDATHRYDSIAISIYIAQPRPGMRAPILKLMETWKPGSDVAQEVAGLQLYQLHREAGIYYQIVRYRKRNTDTMKLYPYASNGKVYVYGVVPFVAGTYVVTENMFEKDAANEKVMRFAVTDMALCKVVKDKNGYIISRNYHDWSKGNLQSEGLIDSMGNKTGIWKLYVEEGILSCTVEYKNGRINGNITEYDKEGNITKVTPYIDDMPKVSWEYHREQKRIKDSLDKLPPPPPPPPVTNPIIDEPTRYVKRTVRFDIHNREDGLITDAVFTINGKKIPYRNNGYWVDSLCQPPFHVVISHPDYLTTKFTSEIEPGELYLMRKDEDYYYNLYGVKIPVLKARDMLLVEMNVYSRSRQVDNKQMRKRLEEILKPINMHIIMAYGDLKWYSPEGSNEQSAWSPYFLVGRNDKSDFEEVNIELAKLRSLTDDISFAGPVLLQHQVPAFPKSLEPRVRIWLKPNLPQQTVERLLYSLRPIEAVKGDSQSDYILVLPSATGMEVNNVIERLQKMKEIQYIQPEIWQHKNISLQQFGKN